MSDMKHNAFLAARKSALLPALSLLSGLEAFFDVSATP